MAVKTQKTNFHKTDKRMKKSKVTKVTKYDKPDSYGNTSYMIEFESGDKGYYRTKNADQKDFIVGQEAEYEVEEKEGKESKKYTNIKKPNSGFQKGGAPFKGPDPKVQIASFSMAYTKDLIVSGKIQVDDLESMFKKMHSLMSSVVWYNS